MTLKDGDSDAIPLRQLRYPRESEDETAFVLGDEDGDDIEWEREAAVVR